MGSGVEEGAQLARAARVLELPERLRLDLAYALAGDRELLTDLFQGVVGVHADAEAHAQDALLARGQRGQNPRRRLAQIGLDRGVQWQDRVLVLDEIAEMRIFLVADRRFEADRLLRDLQYLAHLFQRHRQFLGELLRSRLAADLVQHLARGAHQLVDRLDHVHRDADRARLVGNRAGDRLTDPPCRIGREFIAAAIFEFIDRFHQADIAFLDQIEELQAAVGVFLGDRDDEPEVGLDHLLFRAAGFALAALDGLHDAAELGNRQLRLAGDLGDRRAGTRDIAVMPGRSCASIAASDGPASSPSSSLSLSPSALSSTTTSSLAAAAPSGSPTVSAALMIAAPASSRLAAPYVASRSTMSRSSILFSFSASRQPTIARTVSGLSQMPPIIISRPASMRLAIAISPSRDNSSTDPISRRYMRTGSSVRPMSSSTLPRASLSPSSASAPASAGSSLSSPSTTLMPSSESMVIVSSICSEDTWSCGNAAFSSS